MYKPEIEAVREHLEGLRARLEDTDDDELESGPSDGGPQEREAESLVRQELALLKRIQPAPEKLTRRVHLFPSVGATPGSAGLLVTESGRTVVVAGDAVISREYFEAGRVFEQVYDLQAAQDALRDVIEIADLIVPAHDNLFVVAGR